MIVTLELKRAPTYHPTKDKDGNPGPDTLLPGIDTYGMFDINQIVSIEIIKADQELPPGVEDVVGFIHTAYTVAHGIPESVRSFGINKTDAFDVIPKWIAYNVQQGGFDDLEAALKSVSGNPELTEAVIKYVESNAVALDSSGDEGMCRDNPALRVAFAILEGDKGDKELTSMARSVIVAARNGI